MNLLRSSGLLLFFALAMPAPAQTVQAPSAIAREQSAAIVTIESLGERGEPIGQGSGFIVTAQGAVLTNLHVLQGAAAARVKLANGDVYLTADLIDLDAQKDLAIVKIKGYNLPTVRLGDSDRAEVGASIVVISSPEGLTNSVSTGVISGVRRLDTHRVFQITAPISQGSSGGALFDTEGRVIGITTYLLRSGQNINFALPINYARGLIGGQVTARLPVPAQTASREAARPPEEEISLESQVREATRGRLGRTPAEPMFLRPDEALAFFYRMVDGIGLTDYAQIAELTRTASPLKTNETEKLEEYTIKYLSFYSGLTLGFNKTDRLLSHVVLLVNWTKGDLERAFGDKYKRRTVDGTTFFQFKRFEDGREMVATLDGNGNVREIKFTKPAKRDGK
jgi:hypothetical protein